MYNLINVHNSIISLFILFYFVRFFFLLSQRCFFFQTNTKLKQKRSFILLLLLFLTKQNTQHDITLLFSLDMFETKRDKLLKNKNDCPFLHFIFFLFNRLCIYTFASLFVF